MYITTTSELEIFCQRIKAAKFITIDTEFSRETTYYPKLCLIQIADHDIAVIIDALSPGIDLTALDEILQNPNIIKVFHSAKQDLEILYHLYGHLPINIFDTQIAASFCNFGSTASYESLVLELLNIQIDKSHRISDWSKRPLTQQQIDYALGDVTHLYKIFLKLKQLLEENERIEWALEEMKILDNPNNFIVDVDQVWHKIKNIREVPLNLVIKKLAAWREVKSQQYNLPRNHYLNEVHLLKLAKHTPITIKELKKISHFDKLDDLIGSEIIEVIQRALTQQLEDDLNSPASSSVNNNYYNILTQLKALLQLKANEYQLPSQLLATSSELKELALNGENNNLRFLNGWRYEIFGKFAIQIRNGESGVILDKAVTL